MPDIQAKRGGDLPFSHFLGDPLCTEPSQIAVKDPANGFSAGFLDFKVFPAHKPVSEGSGAGNELAPLHPSLIALPLVLPDGYRFLLGQGAGDAHHQFGGERLRVEVLFFKVNGHTQGRQLPQGGEAVLGVTGEAGDGLDQDLVDPALPAVGQHPVEVLPLIHPSACQALIGIDVHQIPAVMAADLLGVFADLGGVGVKLVGGVGAVNANLKL